MFGMEAELTGGDGASADGMEGSDALTWLRRWCGRDLVTGSAASTEIGLGEGGRRSVERAAALRRSAGSGGSGDWFSEV